MLEIPLEMQLTESMKDAMKAKDTNTLTALRGIKAALLNLRTSEKFAGQDVPEEVKLQALQTMVKQRNESASIFKTNNRQDLADKETFEISVIEKFLPKKLSEAEIEAEVKSVIAELGATSQKEMGKVMGALTKKLAGKADNKIVSTLVKQLLS